MAKKLRNFALALACALPLSLMSGEAELETAHYLLDVMNIEKILDDTINSSVDMVRQSRLQFTYEHEIALRRFYAKYMKSEPVRWDIARIYAEVFSVNEMYDIIAFYQTPTGQKVLNRLPSLMQYSMQVVQKRVMEHAYELEAALEACD